MEVKLPNLFKKFFKQKKEEEFAAIKGKAVCSSLGSPKILGKPQLYHPTAEELEGSHTLEWPGYIGLEMTNVCNLECTHCNYRFGVPHYTRSRGFVEETVVEKVLSEASNYKTKVMMNYDGEPMMNNKFIDYLKLAEEKNVGTYFNTNGMLFSKKFSDDIVSFYNGSISWSIDGNKDWFEKVRVGGDYDRVTKNLDYFLKVNEEAGFPIDVGISFCNLGQGVEDRKEFVDKWIDKVGFVSLGEVNNKDGSIISEPMTKFEVKKRPVCNMPWITLGVCHDGDVVPCSIYITRANTTNSILGNVKEKSIKEIWNDKPIKEFRKMLAEKNLQNTYCQSCERWKNQFHWGFEIENDRKVEINGFWTTVYNQKFKTTAKRIND